LLIWAMPDADGLDLDAEHEAYAADFGGNLATVRIADGTIQRRSSLTAGP
jgi:hypothetical protein